MSSFYLTGPKINFRILTVTTVFIRICIAHAGKLPQMFFSFIEKSESNLKKCFQKIEICK